MRYLLMSFLCLGIAACAPTQQPTKSVRLNNNDVLANIYDAKIHLNSHARTDAAKDVALAKKRLPHFNNKASGQSSLLVELTYLSHGLITKLYIPSVIGDKRFAQTEKVLEKMANANITPLEYRLVNYNRKISVKQAREYLNNALEILNDASITDDSSATTRADARLDDFYRSMGVSLYAGEAKNRLSFHTLASEVFLKHNAFDIARDALKLARNALSDLRLQHGDKKLIHAYAKRLDEIEDAISQKDPSLLGKIGRTIDSWIDGGKK